MDKLYGVFAEHARKHGIDVAVDSFGSLSVEQVATFRERFERDRARVEEGGPPVIAAGREDWYSGPVQQDCFWPAVVRRFEEQEWPDDRVKSVDAASNTVVAHTPRPDRAAWDAKALVVGYVQSGKTTNFISVIAKLADVEYRMAVVLSGIHNGLRRQTQERIDEYLSDLNPEKWFRLTDETRDFLSPPQDPSAVLMTADRVAIAVVKKNTAVLRKLIKWLDTVSGKKALQSAPVLVIDDEADQASVATGRINPLIRRLLGLMPKCTYIGYTATPFANVFIDPSNPDDLYPKSFILNLPRPKGYFGPEKIFGRDGVEGEEIDDDEANPDGYDMVRTVPENDVSLLRPGSREPAEDFTPKITDELADAVHWFWLATAARRARGDNGHSTMLIHTSVKIAVHESYRGPLDAMRAQALDGLARNDADDLACWRDLWNRESQRVPAADFGLTHLNFDEVAKFLPEVVRASRVVLDNYRSQDRLDYSGDPVVAIAVGGNTLSRGLTLEGLVVSFFIRAATAYDTLLQMGRWFGYRRGYEDLPRIWMTPTLECAFRHLATVEYEMRDDIDRYQRENLTPAQVAVRIRTHPSLRITAKMGAAQPVFISYAGRRLQTRYFFHKDAEWLAGNLYAADTLIRQASDRSDPKALENAVLLEEIPVGLVKDFLSRYQVHPDSPDLDTLLMIKYIDEQLAADPPTLQKWSLAIVNGDGPTVDFGSFTIRSVRRSRRNDDDPSRADIKTLMSKQDRALDLGLTLMEARSLGEGELMKKRNEHRVYRERGLLALYAIDAESRPRSAESGVAKHPRRVALEALDTVAAFGIVFPGDVRTKAVQATHVAVDLTDVETDELDEALDFDTEEIA